MCFVKIFKNSNQIWHKKVHFVKDDEIAPTHLFLSERSFHRWIAKCSPVETD